MILKNGKKKGTGTGEEEEEEDEDDDMSMSMSMSMDQSGMSLDQSSMSVDGEDREDGSDQSSVSMGMDLDDTDMSINTSIPSMAATPVSLFPSSSISNNNNKQQQQQQQQRQQQTASNTNTFSSSMLNEAHHDGNTLGIHNLCHGAGNRLSLVLAGETNQLVTFVRVSLSLGLHSNSSDNNGGEYPTREVIDAIARAYSEMNELEQVSNATNESKSESNNGISTGSSKGWKGECPIAALVFAVKMLSKNKNCDDWTSVKKVISAVLSDKIEITKQTTTATAAATTRTISSPNSATPDGTSDAWSRLLSSDYHDRQSVGQRCHLRCLHTNNNTTSNISSNIGMMDLAESEQKEDQDDHQLVTLWNRIVHVSIQAKERHANGAL